MKINYLTRTALLLALALLFQSLRFVFPIPPFFSTFLIGSLVNSVLFTAVQLIGWRYTVMIAIITPLIAYIQGLLPLPIFILPVASGNIVMVLLYSYLIKRSWWQAISLSAIAKTIVLFLSFQILLTWIALPPKIASALLFVMSWPQVLTAFLGAWLSLIVLKRLH